ncbi:hypothetical protein [Isoptericola sp. NPDC056605]|uniref:hypothetical protein n=1 Tax=Isoptericola sp. NPDC056605 TaxID=3345876 RepID=UPI0036BAB273
MANETIDEATRERFRRTNRALLIAAAVLVVVVGVIALVAWQQNQREAAERTDGFYCTLSGVSPYERAPETGRLCADILLND